MSVPPPRPAWVTTSIGFDGKSAALAIVVNCPAATTDVIINENVRKILCIFLRGHISH